MGVVTDEDELELPGEHDEVRKKLEGWSKDLDRHWGDWVKEARRCMSFVAGDQYEDDEEAKLRDGGKIPVTFNRIGPVIDAVVGQEVQARQQTKYEPVNEGAAIVNESLTEAADWIRDQADASGEESDSKRDCFVTGLGAVSTEIDYEEDAEGMITYRRLEPGTALPDSRARQANAVDARYVRHREKLSRDEFKELYGDVEGVFDPQDGSLATHNSDPRESYNQEGDDADTNENLVTVDLWQWYEVETVVMAPSQDGQSIVAYSREQFEALEQAAANAGHKIEGVTRRRRKYMTCRMTGRHFLEEPRAMAFNKFTIQFVTGKRDNKKGVWYGLVRPMIDPQKWANAFFSMLLHMVRTNAKGGIMIEEGAVGDKRQLEETWAKSDEVTVLADGAVSGGRVKEKPQPQYPGSIDRLMEHSIDAIRDVTGVPPEMMGMTDRDQPGILEAQRKQAAHGLLATFFESFRRYCKINGELLLPFMRMLGPQRLVRIAAPEEEQAQHVYVQLQQVLGPENTKYHVVADEMPAGPNQKERTWAVLVQMAPFIKDQLTPELWAEFLKYSPLPESLSLKLRELIVNAKKDQQQQIIMALTEQLQGMQAQMQQAGFQVDLADKAADTRMKDAKTEQTRVETLSTIMRPDPDPQVVM